MVSALSRNYRRSESKVLASSAVVGLLGDGHHPDAAPPEHGLEDEGVLPLAGEAGEFPYEDLPEGGTPEVTIALSAAQLCGNSGA